jgi:hypothetical protein
MRFATLLALTLLAPVARSQTANAPFADLQRITGNWQASVGTKGAIIRVNLRTISNNSALVETFTTPNGRETLTIFHPDGSRLLATHYCAQGNQPRLALDPSSSPAAGMTFRFVDATNLKSEQDAHLIRLVIKIRDNDHFDKTEVYTEHGVEDVTTYNFTRSR